MYIFLIVPYFFFVIEFFFISYRPGWDCHGLPIELKALEHIRVSFTALYSFSACLLFYFSYINREREMIYPQLIFERLRKQKHYRK